MRATASDKTHLKRAQNILSTTRWVVGALACRAQIWVELPERKEQLDDTTSLAWRIPDQWVPRVVLRLKSGCLAQVVRRPSHH